MTVIDTTPAEKPRSPLSEEHKQELLRRIADTEKNPRDEISREEAEAATLARLACHDRTIHRGG